MGENQQETQPTSQVSESGLLIWPNNFFYSTKKISQDSWFVEAFYSIPAVSLPEDVIKEAESAWIEVVAAVNTTQHTDVFEIRFLPIFAATVTCFPRVEGERRFIDEILVKVIR